MGDGKKRIKPALALDPVLPTRLTLAPSNASVFLDAFGQAVAVRIWLSQATAARMPQGATVQGTDSASSRGKLAACPWFYHWKLTKTQQWQELLRSLDDTTPTMPPRNGPAKFLTRPSAPFARAARRLSAVPNMQKIHALRPV